MEQEASKYFKYSVSQVVLNGNASDLDAVEIHIKNKKVPGWNSAYLAFYKPEPLTEWVRWNLNALGPQTNAKFTSATGADQFGQFVHWVYFFWFK